MLRETEYDTFTGETKEWYLNDDGSITCKRSVDLAKMIDNCKLESSLNKGFSSGTKFHKVASIPPIVQHEILKNHGIDVLGATEPAEIKKLERIIELEYPVLKTNNSKLWRPT